MATTIAVVLDDPLWVAGTLVDVVEVEVEDVEVGALVVGVVVTGVVVAGVVTGNVVGVVNGLAVVGASVDGTAIVVEVGCAPACATGNTARRPSRVATMTIPEALRVMAPLIGASAPSKLS